MGISRRKSLKKVQPVKVEGENDDNVNAAITSSSPIVVKDIDEHPISVGNSLVVQYRDGSKRLAKIIEKSGGGDNNEYQYYVHYVDFNRYIFKSIKSYIIIIIIILTLYKINNIDVWTNGLVLIEL